MGSRYFRNNAKRSKKARVNDITHFATKVRMFIVVGLLYIIHMTPFPSQEMRGTTVQPGGNWLSLCQKIPSFLHQHICFASCLFSTWDRVTKHYNHNRKKRTFVKKGPKKDQKRTILAVWSLKGPSP